MTEAAPHHNQSQQKNIQRSHRIRRFIHCNFMLAVVRRIQCSHNHDKSPKIDLDLPVKITSNDITNFQTAINKTYTDFMASAFLKGTAGIASHAGNIHNMNTGIDRCSKTVETARALLKYLNNNTTKPEIHSCMKICKPIDVIDLNALQGRLELSGAKITNSWTTVDVDTDKNRKIIVEMFAQQFLYEMETIYARLTSILNTIDILTSFEYPQDLYGIYHDVPCLGLP